MRLQTISRPFEAGFLFPRYFMIFSSLEAATENANGCSVVKVIDITEEGVDTRWELRGSSNSSVMCIYAPSARSCPGDH